MLCFRVSTVVKGITPVSRELNDLFAVGVGVAVVFTTNWTLDAPQTHGKD